MSRASVSEGQVDKNQTSALVLLLDVLIHENENSLFFLLPSLRSGCDWLCPALLNAVMLTQSIQDLTQIYGQTAIFAHFVRNCHFLSRPFTDRRPIFIDVSVTGSDFDKCNACSIGTPSSQSNLPPNFFGLFPSWKAIVLHTQKNRMICIWLQIIRFFNLRTDFFRPLSNASQNFSFFSSHKVCRRSSTHSCACRDTTCN